MTRLNLMMMILMLGSSAFAYNAADPNMQTTESSSFASDWSRKVKTASLEQVAQVPSFTPSSYDQQESVYGAAGAMLPTGNEEPQAQPVDADKIK